MTKCDWVAFHKSHLRIAEWVTQGLSNREIGFELGCSSDSEATNKGAEAVAKLREFLGSSEATESRSELAITCYRYLEAYRRREEVPAGNAELFGRFQEQRELMNLLEPAPSRNFCVTLTGAAGVGKSCLARSVARSLADEGHRFGGTRIYYLDLRSFRDRTVNPLIELARSTCGDWGEPEKAREQTCEALASAPSIVFLDNADEHLSDVRHMLRRFFERLHDTAFVVTSRIALGETYERKYLVSGLRVEDRSNADDLRREPAIAAISSLAQAAHRNFRFSDDQLPAVVALCRALDGVPLLLALVAPLLAAGRSASDILGELRAMPGAPAIPHADAVAKALRAYDEKLEQSLLHLSLPQRRIFIRTVSMVRGEITEEAAAALNPGANVETCLASAVRGSLISRDVRDPSYPIPSFHAHLGVRNYAQRCLSVRERQELPRRYAEYVCSVVERLHEDYEQAPDDAWFARAATVVDEVRGALDSCLAEEDEAAVVLAARIVVASEYMMRHWAWDEDWIGRVRERLPRDVAPTLSMRLQYLVARACSLDGDYRQALQLGMPLIRSFAAIGDGYGEARALYLCGRASTKAGKPERGIAWLLEAHAKIRDLQKPASEAFVLEALAEAYMRTEPPQLVDAAVQIRRAHDILVSIGATRVAAAVVCLTRAEIEFASQDLDQALKTAQGAAYVLESPNRRSYLTNALNRVTGYYIERWAGAGANHAEIATRLAERALSTALKTRFDVQITHALEQRLAVSVLFEEHRALIACDVIAELLGFFDERLERSKTVRSFAGESIRRRMQQVVERTLDPARTSELVTYGSSRNEEYAVVALRRICPTVRFEGMASRA